MDNELYDAGQGRQWVWDNQSNTLVLTEPHLDKQRQRPVAVRQSARVSFTVEQASIEYKTKFLEVIDQVEQIKFRRHYMRKVKPNEVDVITLQDIKDVVFYLLLTPVPSDFIKFFHTDEVDNYLRALIVYFQYYLEIWDDVQYRSAYDTLKLKHPIGEEREKIAKDHLSDLRCIVARDYSILLLGSGSCKSFHHMSNKQRKSFAEKDLKLFEYLHVFATRVVWIALGRQHIPVIEYELHRMFRSHHFNIIIQKRNLPTEISSNHQQSVLRGDRIKNDRKLFVRSPAILEVSAGSNHSHELLQLGIIPVNNKNSRIVFYQDAYTLTEEYLESSEISVGILGHSRDSYEPLLQPKESLIDSVKIYKISSGLPGIFPGRLTQSDPRTSISDISQVTSSKTTVTSSKTTVTSSKTTVTKEKADDQEERVQIILRSEQYYKELHTQRKIFSEQIWLQFKSIAGHRRRSDDSKLRKHSIGII